MNLTGATYIGLHFGRIGFFTKFRTSSLIFNESLSNSSQIAGGKLPSNYTATVAEADKPSNIVVIQSVVTLFLNLTLFCIIMSKKVLREKTSRQFFLNILFVNSAMSVDSFISAYQFSNDHVIITNGFLMAMFLGLVVTAADRVVATQYPFKYASLSSKNVLQIVLCTWTPSIIFVCSAFAVGVSQYHCTVITTVLITISVVVLSLCNAILYTLARRHFKRKPDGEDDDSTKPTAVYVCIAIVTSFALCWLPYFVHNLLIFAHLYRPDESKTFTKIVEQIAFLNSMADPILYMWLSGEVRMEVRKFAARVCPD